MEGVKENKTAEGHLWDQVFEGVHDFGALGLLVVGEASSDNDNSRQNDAEIQLKSREEQLD